MIPDLIYRIDHLALFLVYSTALPYIGISGKTTATENHHVTQVTSTITITAQGAKMFASLNACVRANPFESAIVVYGLGLFAAAAMYATQIMHAVLMYNPPSVPKNTPQMMYL